MSHPRWWAMVLAAILLAGCQSGLFAPPAAPSADPTPAFGVPTRAATPAATPSVPAPTQAASVDPNALTIWLPPQFNPSSGSPAGDLLKARLEAFQAENPAVTLDVRVKAEDGAGGLLESLAAASAAAPGSLPDLIALPRPDVEAAGLKGLLSPLDGLTAVSKETDWYPYASQIMELQGKTFGLPFAGDALVLVYRPAGVPHPPIDWASLADLGAPVAFPAADPEGLLTLALYQAAGGQIRDTQGRPTLQPDTLAKVLNLYWNGLNKGTFPAGNALFSTDTQVWQAYHDQKENLAFTWISHYLMELPPDTAVATLPQAGPESHTLATGWLWALSSQAPEKKAMATRLAEFLVQGDFLARWTAAAGFLPPRPSALAGWQNQSLRTQINQIEISAAAQPSSDLLGSLGPVLRDAAVQVVKGQGEPVQTAQTAAQRVQAP
jgi:multiple sugar transport system substrate-binding protein